MNRLFRLICFAWCLIGSVVLHAQQGVIKENSPKRYTLFLELMGGGTNTIYTINVAYKILDDKPTSPAIRIGIGYLPDRGWNSISIPFMLQKKWGRVSGKHFFATNIGLTYYYGGIIIAHILDPSLNFEYDYSAIMYNAQVGYAFHPSDRRVRMELGLTTYFGNLVLHRRNGPMDVFEEETVFEIGIWPHVSLGFAF